jgi:hypothetical protein
LGTLSKVMFLGMELRATGKLTTLFCSEINKDCNQTKTAINSERIFKPRFSCSTFSPPFLDD